MENAFLLMARKIIGDQNVKELYTYDELQQHLVDEYNESVGDLTGYNCQICKNKGFIQKYDDKHIVNIQCGCVVPRKAIKNMEKSGLGGLLRDYTFDKYYAKTEWQNKVKGAALRYLSECDKWFYIGGQSGSGKTHICTAICGQLLKRNKVVKYMLWATDIRRLKSYVNDAEMYDKLFYGFVDADVLYIDDLFKTKKEVSDYNGRLRTGDNLTPADIQRTYEIINYRYIKRLPTIISSEKSTDDLIDIDTSIGSRICQLARGYTLELGNDINKNQRLSEDFKS